MFQECEISFSQAQLPIPIFGPRMLIFCPIKLLENSFNMRHLNGPFSQLIAHVRVQLSQGTTEAIAGTVCSHSRLGSSKIPS